MGVRPSRHAGGADLLRLCEDGGQLRACWSQELSVDRTRELLPPSDEAGLRCDGGLQAVSQRMVRLHDPGQRVALLLRDIGRLECAFPLVAQTPRQLVKAHAQRFEGGMLLLQLRVHQLIGSSVDRLGPLLGGSSFCYSCGGSCLGGSTCTIFGLERGACASFSCGGAGLLGEAACLVHSRSVQSHAPSWGLPASGFAARATPPYERTSGLPRAPGVNCGSIRQPLHG